jgi:aminoglycoside 6'-N-acetyltransferase I
MRVYRSWGAGTIFADWVSAAAYRWGVSELAGTDIGCLGFADYAPELTAVSPRVPVHVRGATDLDFNGIISVQADSARPPIEPKLLEKILRDTSRVLFVALEGNIVVGWAKTHYWPRGVGSACAGHYLGGVTVAPSHRRQGVADALTAARLEWIRYRSADAWYIVNANNLASIDLHKRWGFEEVARSSRFHSTEFTGGTGILFHTVIDGDPNELGSSH